MLRIDAIFFDLDGTLVDSGQDIAAAVNYMLSEAGRPRKPYEEILSYVGTGVKDLIMQSLESEEVSLVDKCVELFTDYFSAHYADKSTLYPHVKDVLEFFKHKKMMVVTNRKTEMTRGTLAKYEISGYFQKIIGGDDDNCLKPSACPVKKALSGSVGEDETTLMVGDMDLDVLAGKAAGLYTCGVTYGIGNREDLEKSAPDLLIDDIARLRDLIE